MKSIKKLTLLLVVIVFLLTGCTKYLKDPNNKRIVNEETGQSVPANILCQPKDEKLLNIYVKYKDSLEYQINELPKCESMKIYDAKTYSGLWAQIFVIPLSWLIIKVTALVHNYGISVMLVGLAIRILLVPFSIKTIKQSENMQKAKPELDRLEKKYKDKSDNDAMMQKSQEMMAIYKRHDVSPIGSCLLAFIQLPLFLAFLEAINRTPAIFEETLGMFQLGTTPFVGIKGGNYFYIILIALIIMTTYFAFKNSMNTVGSQSQQQQMKFMLNFMLVFISVASFSLPTAIALYWIVTNAFSVIQNLIIKKRSS